MSNIAIANNETADQVIAAVREAGEKMLAPDAVCDVRVKGRSDFVTNVDMAVQEFLRSRLNGLLPGVQFMSEEADNSSLDPARPFWILDPVDGTTNLIHRCRHSAVSLALAEAGQILFGVVYNPYSGECFTARRGEGAFCCGRPIRVSRTAGLSDALIAAGTLPGCRDPEKDAFGLMRALYCACRDIRLTGCSSLDLCWVASGRLDGCAEPVLKPWDYAAGALIIAEAGGQITALDGGPLSLTQGGGVLASNGLLHTALQSKL